MQDRLAAMCRRVMRHADGVRLETAIPRVGLGVLRRPSLSLSIRAQPMACLVLQGIKEVMIGERVLRYDPAHYFIASLELPLAGRVVEATPERPYVVVSLGFDRGLLAELLVAVPPSQDRSVTGFGVMPVTEDLLASWDNLLALLDTPEDVPVLAPLREREVLYRLLQGPQGDMLRAVARADSRLSQVRRAVQWIHDHFHEPLPVATLADIAAMSVPAFHRHFKTATTMSPLQFQKTLRLQAARLMLATHAETGRAAHSVGYESISQFSREYSRMFGVPPSRDAEALRGGSHGTVAEL